MANPLIHLDFKHGQNAEACKKVKEAFVNYRTGQGLIRT